MAPADPRQAPLTAEAVFFGCERALAGRRAHGGSVSLESIPNKSRQPRAAGGWGRERSQRRGPAPAGIAAQISQRVPACRAGKGSGCSQRSEPSTKARNEVTEPRGARGVLEQLRSSQEGL